jgi:hypothetical protein
MKSGVPCGVLAESDYEPANPFPDVRRMCVHRPDTRRIFLRHEQFGVSARRIVVPVESRAPAPASTSDNLTCVLDDEIRSIVDQLGVESHECVTRSDLPFIEKGLL